MPPIKPSNRREVVLSEDSYARGFNDGIAANQAYHERELWKARHPIRYALQRLRLWYVRKVEGRVYG